MWVGLVFALSAVVVVAAAMGAVNWIVALPALGVVVAVLAGYLMWRGRPPVPPTT